MPSKKMPSGHKISKSEIASEKRHGESTGLSDNLRLMGAYLSSLESLFMKAIYDCEDPTLVGNLKGTLSQLQAWAAFTNGAANRAARLEDIETLVINNLAKSNIKSCRKKFDDVTS